MNVKIVVCLCIVIGTTLAAKKGLTTPALPDISDLKQKPENIEDTYGEFDENLPNEDFEDRTDDDVSPDEVEESKAVAKIKSKPKEFFSNLGETVLLPCETTSTDGVLFWKKEHAFLYQGPIAFSTTNNTKLYENGTLEIKLDSKQDFGTYTCQLIVTKENSPSVNHTIVQLLKPTITSIKTAENRTVYKVGERLVLTCTVTANPKAKISWHKGSHTSINLDIQGETFEIPSLKWSDAGMYRCLADNGVDRAAHDHIIIYVEHAPVVTTDRYFINSNHKESAELRCIVHGYPTPKGGWKRNGENIKKSIKYELTTKRHPETDEYILVINNLEPSDFGEYTCAAKNEFGKDQKEVKLIKIPIVQDFKQPDQKDKDIVVTWKVDSKAEVVEHEFQFRKTGETAWKTHEGSANSTRDDASNGPYTVSYTAVGFEPGSYETRVRSRNEYGWSEYSDPVPFDARASGMTLGPSKLAMIGNVSVILLILHRNRQ